MIHPCAACCLRFATSGELRDHIGTDHVRPVEPPPAGHPHARHRLDAHSYSRSGWVQQPAVEAGQELPTAPGS